VNSNHDKKLIKLNPHIYSLLTFHLWRERQELPGRNQLLRQPLCDRAAGFWELQIKCGEFLGHSHRFDRLLFPVIEREVVSQVRWCGLRVEHHLDSTFWLLEAQILQLNLFCWFTRSVEVSSFFFSSSQNSFTYLHFPLSIPYIFLRFRTLIWSVRKFFFRYRHKLT